MIDLSKCPPKFPLGRLLATPGAIGLGINFAPDLNRHVRGDWGDVDTEDWKINDASIEDGSRIISAYQTAAGRIWIITEADRAVTVSYITKFLSDSASYKTTQFSVELQIWFVLVVYRTQMHIFSNA